MKTKMYILHNKRILKIKTFSLFYKKMIIKENIFWSSLLDYSLIPKIYGLPKTHKSSIPLRSKISDLDTALQKSPSL